jgi:hypothetical protein
MKLKWVLFRMIKVSFLCLLSQSAFAQPKWFFKQTGPNLYWLHVYEQKEAYLIEEIFLVENVKVIKKIFHYDPQDPAPTLVTPVVNAFAASSISQPSAPQEEFQNPDLVDFLSDLNNYEPK